MNDTTHVPVPEGDSQAALMRTLDQLEEMLGASDTGREQAWLERVGWALSDVEEVLGRHQTTAATPAGPLDPDEINTERSPALDRQANKLCQDMNHLLDQVRDLRRAVQELAHPSSNAGDPAGLALWRRAIRPQAEQLLASLRQLKEKEDGLALESLVTDIGVGD